MTDDSVAAAEALQGQIEEAQAAGDQERAQALYQQQQGTAEAPDKPASAAPDGEGDPPAQTGTGEITVATNADDEIVTVSPGMDFAGDPAAVAHAVVCMEVWDGDELEALKAEWGSDMGANLAHFEAFAQAHPDVHEVLVASGFGDHPAIVKAGAILGRRYATTAGDPGQITTKKGAAQMADNTATKDIEERIRALGHEIDKAKVRGESVRANDLYLEQLRLDGLLPGSSEPIIGRDGRTA